MTYSNKPDEAFKDIFEKLSNLEPGDSAQLGPLKNLPKIRFQIYSWLNATSLKPFFRVKTRPPYLVVERKETEITIAKPSEGLPPHLEPFVQALIINEPEGQEALRRAYKEGKISGAEFAEVLTSYHETQR